MLLVRAGALGDILLLRGVVAALHQAGHQVTLLAPRRVGVALLGPGPSEVDTILDWEDVLFGRLLTGRTNDRELSKRLHGLHGAIAYTRSEALATSLRHLVPTVTSHDPQPPGCEEPASDWLARPLATFGASLPPEIASLQATPAETSAARELTEDLPPRFLALHAGSGSPRKNWPADRFAEVAEALSPGRDVLWIQGPADPPPPTGLTHAVVARDLSLRVLGAALASAGLFVGNDSGITHLAAAAGTPTLALYGPTSTKVWRPLGGEVVCLQSSDGTMDALSVEEVLAAARTVLSRSSFSIPDTPAARATPRWW